MGAQTTGEINPWSASVARPHRHSTIVNVFQFREWRGPGEGRAVHSHGLRTSRQALCFGSRRNVRGKVWLFNPSRWDPRQARDTIGLSPTAQLSPAWVARIVERGGVVDSRQVGTSDLRVSTVGLGCNNLGGRLDERGSVEVIERALELGVTFFDTADSYGHEGGSERVLGGALGTRRKDVVIATKFGWPLDGSGHRQGGSQRYVAEAVEASLRRLRTDWIDLYQLHQPDPDTPVEETLGALDDLKRQGKIRYAGCSNLSSEQMRRARSTAEKMSFAGFVSTQSQYNLLVRQVEADLIPALGELGMSLIPYSPLAAGFLSGKFERSQPLPSGSRLAMVPRLSERYLNDRNWLVLEQLLAYAAKHQRSLLELALSWLASRNSVCSVIAGAMSPEQVEANVTAMGWRLSPTNIAEIDAITTSSP